MSENTTPAPTSDNSSSSKSQKRRLILRRRQAEKTSLNKKVLNPEASSFKPSEATRTGEESSEREKNAPLSGNKKQKRKKKLGSNDRSEKTSFQFSCLICAEENVKFIAFGKCNHHICSLCAFRMRYKSRDFLCYMQNRSRYHDSMCDRL